MKNTFALLSASVTLLTLGCQNSAEKKENQQQQDSVSVIDSHTSENSLDWAGVYQDTIPCADCPGILTTVKLYEDGTYAYNAEYLERNMTLQDTGRFMWHNNGSVVHLKGTDIDTKYKVGENVLLQTDSTGNVIEREIADQYSLHKVF
jgi:uncharacterized lipoprotein NlpE involved in copper resistance